MAHQLMHVEHNFHKNMMEWNFQLPFFHIISWTHTGNGATTEQEAYRVYYAVTKWNYCLQGAETIVQNAHKPLARFHNGKNANNKGKQIGIRTSNI